MLSVFLLTDSISSFFCLLSLVFFFVRIRIDDSNVAPAIVHPTGPAIARSAFPATIPPPPAVRAPPPSHASAAFVAAAPERVDIAAPVEAVPNVVATHMAAVGAIKATDAPAASPAPAPPAASLAAFSSISAKSHESVKLFLQMLISSKSVSKLFGLFAMLFTSTST